MVRKPQQDGRTLNESSGWNRLSKTVGFNRLETAFSDIMRHCPPTPVIPPGYDNGLFSKKSGPVVSECLAGWLGDGSEKRREVNVCQGWLPFRCYRWSGSLMMNLVPLPISDSTARLPLCLLVIII